MAKAAMLVNCEFCLDIGAEIARTEGVPQEKLEALSSYADSPVLTDDERLVVEYAAALSASPARVSDDLWGRLTRRFSRTQLTELAAEIAWENQRGRLNQGLRVRPPDSPTARTAWFPRHAGSVRVCASSTTRRPPTT